MFFDKAKSYNTCYYKGFTLAETLIALVVIGVVAALTVPNMIVKHQKEETVTRLKKAYSTIAQTTNKAIADNGPIETWELENGKTKEFFDKYMAPYLNVAKICGYESTGECLFKAKPLSMRNKNVNGSFTSIIYKVILQDGTAVLMNARTFDQDAGNGVTIPQKYLMIYFDINGLNKPNVYGLDIFSYVYWIQNDGSIVPGKANLSGTLLPYGGTPASDGSTREDYITKGCNKNGTGYQCSSLIMADDWQIKDDYPW